MLLAGDLGRVNWYKQCFWTVANICDLGQQGYLYKKDYSGNNEALKISKLWHGFKNSPILGDLCHMLDLFWHLLSRTKWSWPFWLTNYNMGKQLLSIETQLICFFQNCVAPRSAVPCNLLLISGKPLSLVLPGHIPSCQT